jgi:hypothetical protein
MNKNASSTALVRAVSLVLIVLISAGTAAAQSPAKKVCVTRHVNPHAPVIDGKIDDSTWEKVEWAGGFVQHEPDERGLQELQILLRRNRDGGQKITPLIFSRPRTRASCRPSS